MQSKHTRLPHIYVHTQSMGGMMQHTAPQLPRCMFSVLCYNNMMKSHPSFCLPQPMICGLGLACVPLPHRQVIS